MDLVNFDVVVYVTHSVNAINTRHERKNDNLVLNQHTIPYIPVVGWYPYL